MQVPVAVQQHLPILREMGTRDAAGGKELLELLENARRCCTLWIRLLSNLRLSSLGLATALRAVPLQADCTLRAEP